MKLKHTLLGYVVPLLFANTGKLQAQQNTTLPQLLQIAERNYPLLKAKLLDVQAAHQAVNVSRSTLIPSMDASYQANYATYNNLTGMAYPQFLIPISGPPSSDNNMNGVYGSAASLLLNWQPFTFGQRQAQVDVSKANLQYASADAQNEIFQHKIKVINAYLNAITAEELIKVSENNLKRTEANLQTLQSLVVSGIRPEVDTALLKSELSKARVELLNSKKYKEQTRIYLSQLLAVDDPQKITDTFYFSKLPAITLTKDSVKHPLLEVYNSNLEISLARKNALNKTMMPTLGMWGTTYARGSGIANTGVVNSSDGLNFQRFNYGVGVQLSVPLLQFARINPQLRQQSLIIQSGQERLNDVQLQLKKQRELADTTLANSLSISEESPLFFESAKFSYNAVQSRYRAGLANISDLMQAQYVLIKAETDLKLSYLGAWKALLYKAAVNGDLNLFINQVNQK